MRVNIVGAEGVEVAAAVEGVDVGHHGIGSVDGCPSVSHEFLGPSSQLVARSGACGHLLDSVAITDPVEMAAPDVGVDEGEGPAASGYFADE